MAFPTNQTADAKHGTQASNSTSWTGTYPTNLASGDLILGFISSDGAGVASASGFNQTGHLDRAGAVCLTILSRVSDGTETGTFTITISASEQGAWRFLRITDWYGSGFPTGTSFFGDGDGGSFAIASGANTTPDPPSLNPANWDTEDVLWIACTAVDTSRTFSAWPASYSPGDNTWDDVSGGAGGASLSVQHRQLTAASEDPGSFTISTSDDWSAGVVAIRPAAAVAAPVQQRPLLMTLSRR